MGMESLELNASKTTVIASLKSLVVEGARDLGGQPCRRGVVGAKKWTESGSGVGNSAKKRALSVANMAR